MDIENTGFHAASAPVVQIMASRSTEGRIKGLSHFLLTRADKIDLSAKRLLKMFMKTGEIGKGGFSGLERVQNVDI